ncbi:hypothetical protein LTR05_004968 [Lithohypha guttulata]|uniref:SUN domain-containing protein n=1 Tax=Lithohypha guttulata TaxID=1690604 RepID=A0AAN7YH01_9EURO|nr:hypothetical protein LTR05_004968 [Lithohypha guttulata]
MPPKSGLRPRATTPARSTRAATTTLPDTPGTRRSTRGATRLSVAPRDVISNPALPEIQTQQSYAYGSSKTPALPEQLHAQDMKRRAVENRLNAAVDEAERNFEAHAAELRSHSPESQKAARADRAQRRASKEAPQRPMTSSTPDNVRKQNRTAAWIDDSQLDDIPEEETRHDSPESQPQTPPVDRAGSEPSSLPTGSLDHSYNYERGLRRPNLPQPEPEIRPNTVPQQPPERQTQTLSAQRHVSLGSRAYSACQRTLMAFRHWLPYKVGLRMLGLRKTTSPPPVTALETWHDEGDRWCAASVPRPSPNSAKPQAPSIHQDSMRLAIQTSQHIYPTELVVEHFPSSASLEPGTAPRDIELWADFADLSYQEWTKLHIQDLIDESSADNFFPSTDSSAGAKTWARIGTATYATSAVSDTNKAGPGSEYVMSADEIYGQASRNNKDSMRGRNHAREEVEVDHVQRFNLNVNQHGLLHYTNRFLVRVRTNHGSDHTCLYRVRLHGLPLNWEDR